MVKIEMYPIVRLLSVEDLDKRVRSLEKDVRVLKRLYFIRYRYDGLSVEEAARRVGVTKMVGYEWQRRWNKDGVEGLVPVLPAVCLPGWTGIRKTPWGRF